MVIPYTWVRGRLPPLRAVHTALIFWTWLYPWQPLDKVEGRMGKRREENAQIEAAILNPYGSHCSKRGSHTNSPLSGQRREDPINLSQRMPKDSSDI